MKTVEPRCSVCAAPYREALPVQMYGDKLSPLIAPWIKFLCGKCSHRFIRKPTTIEEQA